MSQDSQAILNAMEKFADVMSATATTQQNLGDVAPVMSVEPPSYGSIRVAPQPCSSSKGLFKRAPLEDRVVDCHGGLVEPVQWFVPREEKGPGRL